MDYNAITVTELNKYVRIIAVIVFTMIAMIFILEEQMKKKVAAYFRVSTKEDIQQHSLESQKKYYE